MKICVVQDESSVLFLCFLVQEEKNGYTFKFIYFLKLIIARFVK